MDSLPEDLLIQIFGNFCCHCQHPGHFPSCDDDALANKRTLAHLCRTSKALNVVAEPILYHYYATGNAIIENKPGIYDFLPQFLRTIAQRPDRALRVRAMQLAHDNTLAGYANQVETVKSLIKFSTSRNLLPDPITPGHWLDGPFFSESKYEGSRMFLRRWLISLALVLAPGLRSALLAIDHMADFTYTLGKSTHLKIPSLRVLGIMGFHADYHFTELEHLYSAAPNLETIYACDAGGWSMDNAWAVHQSFEYLIEYDLELANLRRLAISELVPSNLGSLLLCIPRLEDLEYYCHQNDLAEYDLLEILQPVKGTLKRLCASFLPPRLIFEDFYEPEDAGHLPVKSFSDFEKLEDLSFDCRLIYGQDTFGRLSNLLPRSIKRLRISYLHRDVSTSLSGLTSALARFPYIESVTVGIVPESRNFEKLAEMAGEIGELFIANGIDFAIKEDLLGPNPRTMIPGAASGSQWVPLPRILDQTD